MERVLEFCRERDQLLSDGWEMVMEEGPQTVFVRRGNDGVVNQATSI